MNARWFIDGDASLVHDADEAEIEIASVRRYPGGWCVRVGAAEWVAKTRKAGMAQAEARVIDIGRDVEAMRGRR